MTLADPSDSAPIAVPRVTFIGADTFAHYHSLHPAVLGMVRFAGGLVQANVDANLAPDFEIQMTVASMVAGDFVL